ncbi:coiled-coil domain-containing protein 40 [Phymastichus coffea]|uniref:coiled-coil domain-containing protein 40 n=1 Tax=Phymastichus coffea TaxID=108790 RepID=UPI00273A9FA3|nr:coiled-coil domain-containing protein 40 [Phymastichus coffea]
MENTAEKDVGFLDESDDNEYQPKYSVRYRENVSPPMQQKWISNVDENLKILDPDDPLMKRFQDALKSHLLRIDNKLSEEIRELEIAIKDANKTREDEGVALYDVQQEAARQEAAIENYKDMLAEVINLRSDTEERLKIIKETHKKINDEFQGKKSKASKLLQSIESLDMLQRQFSKWQDELSGNVTISQRISEKDAAVQRELLFQKQQKDYILYKLEDEVWRLQSEIRDIDEQLQIKDQEKIALSQTIADANADLEGLKKEHKTLYSAWNSVLNLISQRDKINEEIIVEQRKIRDSLQNLQAQVDKLKKDSSKEMESNERLTALQSRIGEEIKTVKKLYDADKDKYMHLELNFVKVSKLVEQSEKEFNVVQTEYDSIVHEEKSLIKELSKYENQKRELEDDVIIKLDDKVTHDKAIRHLNKLLHESKDFNLENELNLTRLENAYGKSLLELEKINALLDNEKFDLDVAEKRNFEKQKDIEKLQIESRNYDMLLKQKERKIVLLNKKIEEILVSTGKEESNPLDLKIKSMEKNIEEIEGKIKRAQQFWLRQQGFMFSLSQQRDLQMQELGVISKEIMLMEQKNMKLEMELEKQEKEEVNMNRIMNALQQRLLQINIRLTSQKEMKNELEDKNNMVKNEYLKSLKDAEMELIKLQSDIKELNDKKISLKEELKFSQQESLSWEKKVHLASETTKSYKEERNAGGDIALMKSEIHKMEMRLSYLRKAQEKLVQDMEFCISRRDNIIDEAMAREKKNPKSQHNQRIVLRKRLDDQKMKIKQINKEMKQMDNKIANVEAEQNKLLEYLNEGQKLLRENEDIVPDIEKQIIEAELIKHHNLEVLVRKQRKVNMLRDLKNGCYKLLIKNEIAVNDEWQKQQEINGSLQQIMKQTEHDFPLLKNEIRKILLTLETS